MPEMRILTVRQPWAWAIIHGGKDVENRSRSLAGAYRGPVAIHVAQREDVNAFSTSAARDALNAAADRWYERFDPRGELVPPWRQGLGRIIGVADLVDEHQGPVGQYTGCDERLIGGRLICSRWADTQTHHLVLERPRPLAELIPYRGALGLRRLDEDMTARILAQTGDSDDHE